MAKSKFPFITTVLAFIVIAVTVFLFYFLNADPEKSTLFYFNLGYVCFLELLFFIYLGFIRLKAGKPGFTAVFYPVVGTVLLYYIILGALITLGYNLFLTERISVNVFISVLIIATVIVIVITGFVAKADIHHRETTATEAINSEKISELKTAFELAEKKFRRIIKEKGIATSTESNFGSEMEKISGMVRFLPHNALEQESNFNKLSGLLEKVNNFINSFAASAEANPEEVKKSVISFVQDTLDHLEVLKRATRK